MENETYTQRNLELRDSEVKANMGQERLVIWGRKKSLVQTDHIQGHTKILKAGEQKGTELQWVTS